MILSEKQKRKRFDLHAYSYYMVRAIDYYNYVKSELRKKPNIKTLIGSIENIVDGDQGATVTVDGITFECNYCFDSRFDFTNFNQILEISLPKTTFFRVGN
ncbi:MAG: hypothetical protein MZV64_35990 [Ignavibacteriales bacterium]|nr:hypothetical protein [Ignavibacteriales bacterium]